MPITAHAENDSMSVPSAEDHERFKQELLEPDGQVINSYQNNSYFSLLKIKREAGSLSKAQEPILNSLEKLGKLEKQRGELCKVFDPRFGTV